MESVATPAATAAEARSARRETAFASWLSRNAHTVTVVAVYAGAVVALAPQEFVQDSWLTLAGGRDVLHHGLPSTERLTALTHGQAWQDQQWLAKVALHLVAVAGGVRLLALVHALLVVGAITLAALVARRRGASDRAVFWAAAAALPVAPWAWQLRPQAVAYPLFVALLALLSRDDRTQSLRVWLAFPILILWANVHGSVVLGVALGAIAGLVHVARHRFARGGLLFAGSIACLFASPYGLHLVPYFRSLLLNPSMSKYVNEWRAPSFAATWPFFLLAAAVLWFVARRPAQLGWFERGALALTALSGFLAIRGIVWFALAVPLFGPQLLTTFDRPSPLVRRAAVATAALAMLLGLVTIVRLPGAIDRAFPAAAAHAVQRVASGNQHVFASERYADWLLWKVPSLRGRLVYDVRFELFDAQEFRELAHFHAADGPNWDALAGDARIFALDANLDAAPIRALRAEPGSRVLYSDHGLVVLVRGRANSFS